MMMTYESSNGIGDIYLQIYVSTPRYLLADENTELGF